MKILFSNTLTVIGVCAMFWTTACAAQSLDMIQLLRGSSYGVPSSSSSKHQASSVFRRSLETDICQPVNDKPLGRFVPVILLIDDADFDKDIFGPKGGALREDLEDDFRISYNDVAKCDQLGALRKIDRTLVELSAVYTGPSELLEKFSPYLLVAEVECNACQPVPVLWENTPTKESSGSGEPDPACDCPGPDYEVWAETYSNEFLDSGTGSVFGGPDGLWFNATQVPVLSSGCPDSNVITFSFEGVCVPEVTDSPTKSPT